MPLLVLSIIGVILTLLQPVLVITSFGAGSVSDAWFASQTLIVWLASLLSMPLHNVAVPLIVQAEHDQERQLRAAFHLLYCTAIFTLVAAILVSTAHGWLPLLFAQTTQAQPALMQTLVWWLLPQLVFNGMTTALTSSQHAQGRILYAELSNVLTLVPATALLWWVLPHYGPYQGPQAAAAILVIRSMLQALLLLRHNPLHFALAPMQQLLPLYQQRLRPLLSGALYYKSDLLLDRWLCALAPAGQLSLYASAQQAISSIGTVLSKTLVATRLPRMAAVADDSHALQQLFAQGLRSVLQITTALWLLTAASLAWRYWQGLHDDTLSHILAFILLLGGSLIMMPTGYMLTSSFYAEGDTRTPVRVGVIAFSISLPIKIAAFFQGGLVAMAIASSLCHLLGGVVMWLIRRAQFRARG